MTDTSTEPQPNGEAGQDKTGVATESQQAPQEESLDEILANYQPPKLDNRDSQQPQGLNRQSGQPSQSDAMTLLQQTITDMRQEMADMRSQLQQREQQDGLDGVLGDLVKDGGGNKDDAFGFLAVQARHQPEINEIFENRHKDPATWRRTFAALQRKYASRQKAPEQKSNDNDVVREAAAKRAPSDNSQRAEKFDLDPDGVSKMSEEEWRAFKRKKGIREY